MLLTPTLLAVAASVASPVQEAPAVAGADTVGVVPTIEYLVANRGVDEGVWRLAVETQQGVSRAFVERLVEFNDPDRDDKVVFRTAVEGLTFDEASGEVRWTTGSRTVVCGVVKSDFWSGYIPRLKETGVCVLRSEVVSEWRDTGTRVESQTRERVWIEAH